PCDVADQGEIGAEHDERRRPRERSYRPAGHPLPRALLEASPRAVNSRAPIRGVVSALGGCASDGARA
ncbi:hypothetical protein, partial [Saccharothrix sp. ST-888]|uniref:hypothetical protein n=1 Tax=Saccharothrix sp. ST-888 TaxID=1427391 RepID=UPI001E2E01D1